MLPLLHFAGTQRPPVIERMGDRKKTPTPEHFHWLQQKISALGDMPHSQASLPVLVISFCLSEEPKEGLECSSPPEEI